MSFVNFAVAFSIKDYESGVISLRKIIEGIKLKDFFYFTV